MPNQESTFFNVMSEAVPDNVPKTKGTLSATPTVAKITMQTSSGSGGIFKRKAIIIPAAIILLGLIGGGAYLFLRSEDDTQVPEVKNDTVTPPTADPDVTTPADWLSRYFGSETCTVKTTCGDSADPDRDGYTNKDENNFGTDPNNPDSDGDGLADGDEHHIFKSDPLLTRTYREGEYNDSDFVKGSYDIQTNLPYTPDQLTTLKAAVKERGLHQPTLTTIGTLALTIYDFTDPNAPDSSAMQNIDQSPQAKLDRDTQRQSTIKKIGGALIKYFESKKSYPIGSDFIAMSDAIGPFNTVATNYNDPINKEQYVYGYEGAASGSDFTLTYYSETQNQLIKYTAKNAQEAALKENAQKNNEQRIADLENITSALMIYSTANADSNSTQINVFPTKEQYPSVLIPRYITTVPKDPNGAEYAYEVSALYDTFTLKATFQNPSTGVTGYLCNPDGCRNY